MDRTLHPIDAFLGPEAEKEVYGYAYDLCVRYFKDILLKMSSALGWKGVGVPFDFSGFSGYWPDITDGGVDIRHGEEVIGTFLPREDGSLGLETSGDELAFAREFSPWEILDDFRRGFLFGSTDNIRRAKEEFHDGRCIIYGLRLGGAVAYAAPRGDDLLRRHLAATGTVVRFTTAGALSDALGRYLRTNAVPGFEDGESPQVVRYIYDGQDLRSEKDVSVGVERSSKRDYLSDWAVIDLVRSAGERMRREFERAAGVPEGRHFRFGEAVYPTLGIRDDALFLATRYGSVHGGFITCSRGAVCLYGDYDPDRGLSAPRARFSGIDDAIAGLRKMVFCERNLGIARREYLAFSQGRSMTIGH